MRYIEEFQSSRAVLPALEKLQKAVRSGYSYKIMEFCGGHTHTFLKTGLMNLLPQEIGLVHGPGCPVCVLPSEPIRNCIQLLERYPDVTVCTYGDIMKVPTLDGDSFLQAKGRGLSIIPVYSPLDALSCARSDPHRKIVFLAVGFETTVPPTALAIHQAVEEGLNNFLVYCNHFNTGAALEYVLKQEKKEGPVVNGFIGPGHVSLVTGSAFFEHYARFFYKPFVIAGFTPYDLVISLIMLVRQINAGDAKVEVQYSRAVVRKGNSLSQAVIEKYLEVKESCEWRGLGKLSGSGYRLRPAYANHDAGSIFSLHEKYGADQEGCRCSEILLGQIKPTECKSFGADCTPEHPQGPCMVSSEGACSAYHIAGYRTHSEGQDLL